MDMLVIAATIGAFALMGLIFHRAFRGGPNKDAGELPGKAE